MEWWRGGPPHTGRGERGERGRGWLQPLLGVRRYLGLQCGSWLLEPSCAFPLYFRVRRPSGLSLRRSRSILLALWKQPADVYILLQYRPWFTADAPVGRLSEAHDCSWMRRCIEEGGRDGGMDEWMDEYWMDKWMDRLMNGWMHEWMNDAWTN